MPSQLIVDIIPPKLKYLIEASNPDSQLRLILIKTYNVNDSPSIVRPKTIRSIVEVKSNKKKVLKPIRSGNSRWLLDLCISTINPWENFKIKTEENNFETWAQWDTISLFYNLFGKNWIWTNGIIKNP